MLLLWLFSIELLDYDSILKVLNSLDALLLKNKARNDFFYFKEAIANANICWSDFTYLTLKKIIERNLQTTPVDFLCFSL